MKHYCYLKYVLRHKYFVLRAGLKTGAPLRQLIIHDWSKFTRAEWFPYVEKFYGEHVAGDADRVRDEFRAAFRLHESRNPHHWQHWTRTPGNVPEPMPVKYIEEMVADWMGAGRAITGEWEVHAWYEANKAKIQLHPRTRLQVEYLLREVKI